MEQALRKEEERDTSARQTKQELMSRLLKKQRAHDLPGPVLRKRPRHEGPNSFPLSFSQKRLWFLSAFSKEAASLYNTHVAYAISGRLDREVLERALNALIDRHEIMRTRFRADGAAPLQTVEPRFHASLPLRIVKKRTRNTAYAAVHEHMRVLLNQPLALDTLPLFHVMLYHISKREFVLCFVLHHIITDGWSIDVLLRDLFTAYDNLIRNAPAYPDEPPLHYGDYAAWEQAYFNEPEILTPKLQTWKRLLGNDFFHLNLPLDFKRPPVQSHRGETRMIDIPPALVTDLSTHAARANCTLFHVLLACYFVVLYRYSNQESVNVGIPVANRNKQAIENVLGCFINTAVVSVRDIDDAMPFDMFLQRVKGVCLDAVSNQDVPFEKLIEELNPPRDTSRTPLFQTSFNYYPSPPDTLRSPGLTFEGLVFNRKVSLFDLALNVWPTGGTLLIKLEYDTALFAPETMKRFANHYRNILREIVRHPGREIGAIRLLSEEEYNRQVFEWNTCAKRVTFPDCSVIDLFLRKARSLPDRTALFCGDRELTYGELLSRTQKLAGYLKAQGVQPEEKIVIVMESSLEIVIGILGILLAGAAYVPVDPKNPGSRLHYILTATNARFVLTQGDLVSHIPDTGRARTLVLDPDVTLAEASDAFTPGDIPPDSLMYVLFTSGSTGAPKGVEIEHKSLAYYLQTVLHDLGIKKPTNFAIATSFAADLGTTNLWGSLCTGGTLHIIPYEQAIDPRGMIAYLKKHVINIFKLTPSFFKVLKAYANVTDILPTDYLILAGEALEWDIVKEIEESGLGCRVENHYGPTESTVAALHYSCHTGLSSVTGTVPIGRPFSNRRVYVLDRRRLPAPVGVPGELYIGEPGLARGYLGQPEQTQQRFIPSPFPGSEGERMYKTGDLVRQLPDGNIEFLGRCDFQVKIKGYRIELEEIEQRIRLHPAVNSAVVCVQKGSNNQERLVAFYDAAETAAIPQAKDIKAFLADGLPEYMIPTHFFHLEKLPLTGNGKIDRTRLQGQIPETVVIEPKTDFEEPRTDREKEIAGAWEAALRIKGIGRNENFFDLGGESLTAMWLMRKIAPRHSVIELFKHPTIRELAELLSQREKGEDGMLYELTDPVPASADCLTLVCIPQGGGDIITFASLAEELNGSCRVLAVKIPGHAIGKRNEPLQPLKTTARAIVEELAKMKGRPIALYAHCVGGALGVEVARRLAEEGHHLVRIFQAGNFPSPRLPGKVMAFWEKLFPRRRFISDKAFKDMLRSSGGVESETAGEELDHIIRCMRHDAFEAEDYYTEWYNARHEEKLNVPLTCVVGERDRMTEFYREQYLDWEAFSESVDLSVIDQAGHYFHKYQANALADIIREKALGLKPAAPSPAAAVETPAPPASSNVKPKLLTFLTVAIGQLFSMVGSRMTTFALGIWVFGKTGSVTDFAVIGVFAVLPGVLALPLAGAIADRFNKRLVMILSDAAAAAATLLVVVLLWTGQLALWHIYLAAAIGAVANAFQRPAYIAAVAQLVPKRYLGHANGIVQLTTSTAEMIAPVLGGALVGLISLQGIILIDFITFFIAVGTLAVVRFPNTLFKRLEEPIVKEIWGGVRFILKRQPLVIMIVFFFIFNLVFNITTALYTPMILTLFSEEALGSVIAFIGAGGIAGALLMSIWGGTKKRAHGMVGSIILVGLSTVLMGLHLWLPSIILGTFGVWVGISLINTHWLALMQTKVGLELLGRVISINQMLAWLSIPLGYLLGGALADGIFEPLALQADSILSFAKPLLEQAPGHGMRLIILAAGVFMSGWGIVGLSIRKLRTMEDILPDVAADVVIPAEKDKIQRKADLLYQKHLAKTLGKRR